MDNGSTDGSVGFVKGMFTNDARLKIIQNTANLGWSPANNQGMRIAKGEIIVCVSNDMIVEIQLDQRNCQGHESRQTYWYGSV